MTQALPLMSPQSGGHTGLAASKLQHGLGGGHDEWRDAHLQPDAHEESFSVDERPEEVCGRQSCLDYSVVSPSPVGNKSI